MISDGQWFMVVIMMVKDWLVMVDGDYDWCMMTIVLVDWWLADDLLLIMMIMIMIMGGY